MAIYTHNEVVGSPPLSWLTVLSGSLSFASISLTEVVIANSDGTFTHASLGGGVVTSLARTDALNAPFTTYETLTGLMVPALNLLNASTATLQTLFLGGNDTFTGWSGADGLLGFAGDDTFTGGGGSDTIDGGTGVGDKAIYSGAWIDYAISGGATLTIADTRGGSPDGTDTVSNVENFQFANGTFTAAQIINDAPTDLIVSASTISENAANNTIIGSLTRIDADVALGDTATFTLVDDAGGRFGISGNNLVAANGLLLDFEQTQSWVVKVRVTDHGGLFFDKSITIGVANVGQEFIIGDAANNTFVGGALKDTINAGGGERHCDRRIAKRPADRRARQGHLQIRYY